MFFAQFRVFAQGRQVLESIEGEESQKCVARAIDKWSTDIIGTSDDTQQLELHKGAQRRTTVDAAHVVDIGACEWLSIGDKGQHFDCLTAELYDTPGPDRY